MWTIKHVTMVLAFLIPAMACVRLFGGSEWIGQMSASRHMGSIVKVTADAAVIPLDFGVLESLLRSDAVAGQAARTALNVEYGEISKSIDVWPANAGRESQGPREPPMAAGPGVIGTPIPSGAQMAFLSLSVDLPDRVKPAAWAFAGAVVENLQHQLEKAFNAHVELLTEELKRARGEQDAALAAMSETMRKVLSRDVAEIQVDRANMDVIEQLDKVVDLSTLNPVMPLGDAIELIRRSVDPPLQIVVLWRELLDNAQIESSSPINMNGLPSVRLRAALRNLLDAMSNPQMDIRLDYVISDGVITIGTRESLPQRRMETRVHEVPALLRTAGRVDGLKELIEQTVEPDSWFDLSELGKGSIVLCGDTKLVVWQTSEIHKKIADLLRTMAPGFPVTTPVDASREVLEQQMQQLLAYRNTLNGEIDRLQERQGVLAREKNDSKRQAMESSLRTASSELYRTITDLEVVRARISASAQNAPEADAIAKAIGKIRQCADTCANVSSQGTPHLDGGGDVTLAPAPWLPLDPTLNEEQTLVRRLVTKQSELEQVSHRIARIHNALTGQTTFDPEVHHLHVAARRLEEADLRVQQLERQIVALQPCSVTLFPPTR